MTPMPKYEDYLFLRKYQALSKKSYLYIYTCFSTLAFLIIWWSVLVCVFTAFIINYLCNIFHIFQEESHAIYITVCRNMAAILEYFSKMKKNYYTKLPRTRIIMDNVKNTPYLIRHYLLIQNRKTFPFNVFIHKIMKGDDDDIHDHPWGFFHIILSGGYWEYVTVNDDGETLDQGVKKVWRPPGHWNVVSANYKHKIELGIDKPWTIFIPFIKHSINKQWGFWKPPNSDSEPNAWKKIESSTYLSEKMQK